MSLKDKFDQLEERERKLLSIFGAVLGTMVLILIPLFFVMSVSSQADANRQMRDIIESIDDERATLARRQASKERVEARYARKAPPLAGFLAKIADRVGVDIPETQDRSTIPHKNFKERITKIRLRKIGMFKLADLMEKIENSGYAVTISRLIIRKSGGKPDKFDAEMEISAFDRDESKKKSKSKSASDKKTSAE